MLKKLFLSYCQPNLTPLLAKSLESAIGMNTFLKLKNVLVTSKKVTKGSIKNILFNTKVLSNFMSSSNKILKNFKKRRLILETKMKYVLV